MNRTESLTATTSTRDQEDHGYIVFDSHSSNILDADYTADASTVSSLSLSLILDEETPTKRARFDQGSCVPTEISDDDCFRALSPSDGLGRNTYVLPASNNAGLVDRKIPRKPSSMLQVPVPDPMVPISLPNILPNPQCAMDPSPTSPSPKRKRIASYSKNELNLLFDSIEKAFVNNATKTIGVLEIMRRSGLRNESKTNTAWPMGYIPVRHQKLNPFDQEITAFQKTHGKNSTRVPNPLAAHEGVPPAIQVPYSTLGLSTEVDEDNVSELGLDDQYQDLIEYAPVSRTDINTKINDVLDTPLSTFLPPPQLPPIAILVPPSLE